MAENKNRFVDFFENISICGLWYLFGYNRILKWLWCLLFLLMVAMTVWSLVNCIKLYLKFDLSTSIEYHLEPVLDFPAITICNENVFLKDRIGFSDLTLSMVSNYFTDVSEKSSENSGTSVNMNFLLQATLNDFGSVMPSLSQASDSAVIKCWWNKVEIDCHGQFYNQFDLSGLCFTFNPDKAILSDDKTSDPNNQYSIGSGINLTSYKRKMSSIAGPNAGLQLLMNVDQANYCGIIRKWRGAGFRSYVHDPSVLPSYYLDKPILLHPGSLTSVFITPSSITRKTEHLGECMSSVDLSMSSVQGKYFLSPCILECCLSKVYERCNCTPSGVPNFRNRLAEILNVPKEKVPPVCLPKQYRCAADAYSSVNAQNLQQACPKCKAPCFERKYDYQVSTTIYPSVRENNVTGKDISFNHKNLVMVKFSLESLRLTNILEQQKYTLMDLFIYFGGYIELFLGMSVLSFAELFQLVGYSVSKLCKVVVFPRNPKMQSILKNQTYFFYRPTNKRITRKVKKTFVEHFGGYIGLFLGMPALRFVKIFQFFVYGITKICKIVGFPRSPKVQSIPKNQTYFDHHPRNKPLKQITRKVKKIQVTSFNTVKR